MLLTGHDDAVAHVVGAGLQQRIEPPYTALGIVRNNTIVGGYVLNDFNGANVELTAYAPRMLWPSHLRVIAQYAFGTLGCRRISARARRDNKPSIRTLIKAGFAWEGVLKGYFPQGDAILYALHKDKCRWFRP